MRHSKRFFLTLALLTACGVVFARADDNITNVQNRLKTDGFYSGNPTGILDSETVAALRRFQKRHGLALSGKLDTPTARELNASAPKPPPTLQTLTGTWRRLPSGEMQFEQEQPTTTSPPAVAANSPAPAPAQRLQPVPPAEAPATPPPIAESRPSPTPPLQANVAPTHRPPSGGNIENPERFRDYVEAFVQAGLARPQGSEIKFFADNVDYLGTSNIPRQEVQRDLVRYNQKWPHRRFWIDGDIQIQQQSDGNEIKLVFPVRYELRNGSRYASGKVLKSLTLLKTANNEMQITALNEWKAP